MTFQHLINPLTYILYVGTEKQADTFTVQPELSDYINSFLVQSCWGVIKL